ncbi:MAG: SRPBCC family protein [Candidatus Microthrix sp.]|nr:SRPBCC family protein [Candidatus Microthrix sp.]
MPRYVVHVSTPMPPAEAFVYMADLNNFARWDPGVDDVDQVEGSGPGPESVFDVSVKAVMGTMTLRYETTTYEAPSLFVARAQSTTLTSLDTITVRPDGTGSVVGYEAELTLNGLVRFADPLLGLAFGRIGDRAAGGLIDALDGERVDPPT